MEMNEIWKKELPYDLLDDDILSFDSPVYVYDGFTIKKGHFNSKHGVTLFISAYDCEETELKFELWCWASEFNRELDKLWVNWN